MNHLRYTFQIMLAVIVLLMASGIAHAATPVATTFTVTASTVGSTLMHLQGSDPDGTPLVFSFTSSPAHGSISGFDSATGYFVYTPSPGYTGSDGIFFVVTSGGQTSSGATCSITITNQKTRIIDTLTNLDGTPRSGKVTFILKQKVQSPGGIIPVSSSVSAVLNGFGQFDLSVYPSSSLSPQSFYEVLFEATDSLRRESLGIYHIPATAAVSITLGPNRVTDTNLAAQYVFVDYASLNTILTASAGGAVASVFGRTGTVTAQSGDYSFSQLSGAATDAQVPDTITLTNFNQITTRSASDLSSGTLPDARFPSTLPALSGTNLTNLNASALSSGTVPVARLDLSSFGFTDGTGVAGRLSYWADSNTLASSPLVRISGDETEHRGTGGATKFAVSAGYSTPSSYARAVIDASNTVIIFGGEKAGDETGIPVRLSSINGADVQLGAVWYDATSEAFKPHTNDAFDLGASDRWWWNGFIHNLRSTTRFSDAAADYSITPEESGTTFTNRGASGAVVFALPPVSPGLRYTFILTEASQALTVQDSGGAQIYNGRTAAGSWSASHKGDSLTVECDGTDWYVVATSDASEWSGA